MLKSRNFQETCNVRNMSPELLPDLLSRVLPADWLGKDIITGLQPENEAQEVKTGAVLGIWQWLFRLWIYLCGDSKRISVVAEGIPIVPVQGGNVCALSRRSKLIMGQAFPSSLQLVLQQAGLNIVTEDLLPESVPVPGVLWQYINQPTRSGLLVAIGALTRESNWQMQFNRLRERDRTELYTFLSHSETATSLSDIECATIRQLPIFRRHSGHQKSELPEEETFTSLVDAAFGVLQDEEGLNPLFIDSSFLCRRNPHEIEFLRRLGVKVVSKAQYYTETFLQNLSSMPQELYDARDSAIATMLLSLAQLLRDDKAFASKLALTNFVPSAGNAAFLCKPSELLDPRVPELVEVLDSHFFPADALCTPETLSALHGVGLKTSLSWDGIVKCAISIQTVSEENMVDARRRGQSLLRFLDREAPQLLQQGSPKKEGLNILARLMGPSKEEEAQRAHTEKSLEKLRLIEWIPVVQQPIDPLMPWHPSPGLCAPNMCVLPHQAWYCSSSKSIVEEDVRSTALSQALGWSEEQPPLLVAQQLRDLSVLYGQVLHQSNYDREGQLDIVRTRQTLSTVVPRLYQTLNRVQGSDMHVVRETLFSIPWIWVGEKFVKIEQVAFTSPVNAAPYLYTVPTDLAVFSNLLEAFGVRRNLSASDFRQVLLSMASETRADLQSQPDTKPNPLIPTQLELAISLIQILSDEGNRAADWELFVPDDRGILVKAHELVYDDAPWLSEQPRQGVANVRFCHPKISPKVGEKIGVRSLRLLLLTQTATTMDFESEAFGQAESLTRRLRNILDMYAEGLPIISELLQNADDANASLVRIVYSQKQFGEQSLLGPKMAAWQGPGIYA
jgi:sacsin